MFVKIDLVHKEAPAFWSQLPGQDMALGWVAMSLMGMLSNRDCYCHGREAVPSCMLPSQTIEQAGAGHHGETASS